MKLEKSKKPTEGKKNQGKLLLSKLKENDHEAFIEAYDLYVDQIYRFVYFKISNQEDAQDLTSVVFLKTWNYIRENSLKDVRTLRALMYKVARNSVIDHYRKKFQTDLSIDQEGGMDIADRSQDIARKMEIKSDFKIIENKLRELKDEYREIIVLRFIDELSVKEIAEIIEKSNSNVRVIIHRALKTLKKSLEEG